MEQSADDLLLFARVAALGSFSRAAEQLRVPKSTVSRRVSALETRLGERLLQRTTRKLVLTDFGQGILEHARTLAGEVDAALAFALHRQSRPRGVLRISVPGDFASLALAPTLAGFIADYPDIELDVDLSPRRVDLIGEGFDLAIRMGELQDDDQLTARRLALFGNGLYAAPSLLRAHGEPKTPDALLTLPGLVLRMRSGDTAPWPLSGDGPSGGAPPPLQIRPVRRVAANSPDLLIRLARQGVGVAAASEFFAQPYVARGELVRLLPDWCLPPSPAWAVFPGRRLMPAKTRVFIDALVAGLQAADEPA